MLAVNLEGTLEIIVHVPPFPFCIDSLPDRRLLVVSSSDRQLLTSGAGGSLGDPREPAQQLRVVWAELTAFDA